MDNSTYQFSKIDDIEHVGAKLGKGAFAQVKLVQHKATGKMLALKIIDMSLSQNYDEELAQIMVECSTHKSLHHPNIIK